MNTSFEIALRRKMSFREWLSWKIAFGLKGLYFYLRKKRKPWDITMESIQAMPKGTLGNDLYWFLKKNKLSIMPRAEFHDVYHVLFEYNTSIRDEAMIQFVPLGNGRISLPFLSCTFVSAVFFPEYWSDFYQAFLRGKRANTFHNWDFESLLEMPTVEVRKKIWSV